MIVLAACGGEENITGDFGEAYFPLQTGMYRIYDVHEIHYAPGAAPSVTRYELMTEVVDSFPSTDNQYAFVIHRSKRAEGATQWEPLDTWSARKDTRQVVVSEGNVPFVKLAFPVAIRTRWDGNAFNTLGADDYAFSAVNSPFQVGGMTFEHTATVEQENNPDLIVFHDQRTETYARDLGMIYRKIVQLHYCTDDPCLGQQEIDHGVEIEVSMKEYGKY